MKTMKKVFALLLALTMIMSLAISVAADEPTHTINITNAVDGQTYKAYKIFDATGTGTTVSYTLPVGSEWKSVIDEYIAVGGDHEGELALTPSADETSYVVTVPTGKTLDAAAFAAALDAAKAGKTVAGTVTAASGAAVINVSTSGSGYYFVDTSLGALCSLDTVTGLAKNIAEKNEKPNVVKKVEEDSTGAYGATNDADIGQTINFKATITVAKGNDEQIVLHDTMSAGLTFKAVTSVTKDGIAVPAANYSVTAPGTDDCTFDVTFTADYIKSIAPTGIETVTIVVEYTAYLNENAVIAGANPNTVTIVYGDDNKYTSEPSTTNSYTYALAVYKTNAANVALGEGVKFALKKGGAALNVIEVAKGLYRMPLPSETATSNVVETNANGKIVVYGLDADTYTLTETETLPGYNLLTAPESIALTSNLATYADSITVDGDAIPLAKKAIADHVINKSGSTLPDTGGIGTTIFYVVGGMMMLGAVVVLVTMKKMSGKAER